MKPRRLLMISTDRKIFEEGSDVRARQIQYAKDWDEVHIVVFAGKEFNEAVLSNNCWAYSTRSRSKFTYPFDAMRLGRFIIEKRGITDITCQDASLTAMVGVSLKKQFHIPLEIQIHEDIGSPNYGYSWTNKIRKFLALNYIPRADSIRAVSNRIKEYLVGRLNVSDSKITVRPIFVDVEAIKRAPVIKGADLHKKYPQFEKIILMASRLTKEKNIRLGLDAFEIVSQRSPKVGLIIVGEGSQGSNLKSRISKLNLDRSVIFEPWTDKNTLISYYKTADLYLNTSLFEGYGMALVEAKAAGCKIVSTDVGVAKEIGVTIVEPDPEAIAAAVLRVLV